MLIKQKKLKALVAVITVSLAVFFIFLLGRESVLNADYVPNRAIVSKNHILIDVYDYTYGMILFKEIAYKLTKDIKRNDDKIAAISGWVFDNIMQNELMPSDGLSDIDKKSRALPVIDDNFLNIARRGYGFCDQGAHVLATMAKLLGFDSKLLMLSDDKGYIFHTVAAIKIDKDWHIVDTTFKFTFRAKDASLIPLGELNKNTLVFEEYRRVIKENINKINPAYRENFLSLSPAQFSKAIEFRTFPYLGLRGVLKKFSDKLDRKNYNDHGKKSVNVSAGGLRIDPGSLYLYDKARVLELRGELKKAMQVLDLLIAKKDQGYLYFLAVFQKGVILYKTGNIGGSRMYFKSLAESAPKDYLQNGVDFFLAN